MKILKIIVDVILTLIIIVGAGCIAMYIYGIRPYVVISGSMEPTIKTGSVSFINTKVDFNSDVAFNSNVLLNSDIKFNSDYIVFEIHLEYL